MKEFFNKLFLTFTKESSLAGIFFFFVLSSWYVLRPVRNEMAVANVDNLPLLLAVGALAMLLVNPIYSRLALKTNLRKLLIYCYLFFIFNLLGFLFAWKVLDLEGVLWLGRAFYIWCNIYSFFVVSIFWVVIINVFRSSKTRNFYGVIMAGGSIGALVGSEISKRFANSFTDSGLEFFSISAIALLFAGLCIGLLLINHTNSKLNQKLSQPPGGDSFDGIKNAITKKDIRSIAIYVWLFTGLMTVHWMTAISIIDAWSSDSVERIALFGQMEQMVTILTLPTQLLLTSIIINFLGVGRILFLYGVAFLIVFSTYAISPTISIVIFATVFLRLFEYAINKPTREIVFSHLKQNDRYKSSVFIDTFCTRLGDLSGSLFISLGNVMGVGFSLIPIFAMPIAGIFSYFGIKIAKETKIY